MEMRHLTDVGKRDIQHSSRVEGEGKRHTAQGQGEGEGGEDM